MTGQRSGIVGEPALPRPGDLDAAGLAALLDKVPSVAGKPRSVEDLSGGLTNRNVKVTSPRGVFVARCSSTSGDLLAINRDHEYENSTRAAAVGVGAPVVEYQPQAGVLVIGYIDGRTLTNEDFQTPGTVRRVARACRQLHAGPRFANDFDMFAIQRSYLQVVESHGFRHPDGYVDLMPQLEQVRKALTFRAEPTVPCNNDLLAGNIVDDGTQLWLIDYEYSGNNDACFELGNIWSECGLDDHQLEELVTEYYGAPLRNKVARARLQGLVSKYGWTLWGSIQSAVSPLDFDFWSWAMERYDAVATEFRAKEFARLLDDVQRVD